MTLNVTDLTIGQEPEIGQNYMVPCVNLTQSSLPVGKNLVWSYFTKKEVLPHLVALPVIGNPHRDPEFPNAGGERKHIHIDTRFVTEWELEKVWEISSYIANDTSHGKFPIIPIEQDDHRINLDIFLHEKMCFRKYGDFRDREVSSRFHYGKFEDEMSKHQIDLNNPVCPHHGTILKGVAIRDGIITCPLHASTWCAATGKYKRKTREKDYDTGRDLQNY